MTDKPVINECNIMDFFSAGLKIGFYIKVNDLKLIRATVLAINHAAEEFSTTTPTVDLDPFNLEIGTDTVAQVFTEYGIVRFPTTLLRIKSGPPHVFYFTLPEVGKHIQYRKYPRIDIFASFRITNIEINKPVIRSSTPYPVNISSGGLRIEYPTSEIHPDIDYNFKGRLHYFEHGGYDNRALELDIGLRIMSRESVIKTASIKPGHLVPLVTNKVIVGKWLPKNPDDTIDINEYVLLYMRRFKKSRT